MPGKKKNPFGMANKKAKSRKVAKKSATKKARKQGKGGNGGATMY